MLSSDVETISRLAEFGVVTLMFTIGLELSFERLKRLRRLVFGLGPAQLLVSTGLIAGAALLAGLSPAGAIVFGAALSLSSTAMVVPALAEAKLQRSLTGRYAFAVLLFQDLSVAPLLFMVSLLSGGADGFAWRLTLTVAPAAAAVGGADHFRPARLEAAFPLRWRCRAARNSSWPPACWWCWAPGLIAAASGLSMALGAFLAGLLLAETEFRREVEVTIEPFKGLALGLFFVSIGAELDPGLRWKSPALVSGRSRVFIGLKTLSFYPLARLFGAAAGGGARSGADAGAGRRVRVRAWPGSGSPGVSSIAATGDDAMQAAALSMVAIPFARRMLWGSTARRRALNIPAEAKVAPPRTASDGRHHRRLRPRRRADRRHAGGPRDPVHRRRFRRGCRRRGAARRQARLFRRRDAAGIPAPCGVETARAVVVTMDRPGEAERWSRRRASSGRT